MKTIDQVLGIVKRPERILQYGEGNFLRAFADWQIDILNERTGFNGNVAAVQPRNREGGAGALINAQGGLYTTVLRGLVDGRAVEEFRPVRSLSRCINPYTQFDEYFACAENPDLRFVFSNTTEAGIVYRAGERLDDRPQLSFPGKVTALLYRRYDFFRGDPAKALVFIPCELIDRNGETLRALVERYAAEWGLGDGFARWLKSCVFCNTLVDRIVSGFPGEEAEALWEKLGYRDDLLTAGELFYLWVIEEPPAWDYRKEFPLEEAGLKVVWTGDLDFYRKRKVRVLNGLHSSTALAAYLYGLDTVAQCVEDPLVYRFMRRSLFGEIIPSLELNSAESRTNSNTNNSRDAAGVSREGLVHFAEETLERFANPFIKHRLLSISLNSLSKFKIRVLPSILSYYKKYRGAPRALCCSLAALILFYRGRNPSANEMEGRRAGEFYPIRDDEEILRRFAALWDAAAASGAADCRGAESGSGSSGPPAPAYDLSSLAELVRAVLSFGDWWGEDLNAYSGIGEAVTENLALILRAGMGEALARAAGEDREGFR
ncbi:MAG: tagaturonate reductase [Treponema sp.]|nr:tagaturonate reductase [Treponema sp.]